MSDTRLHTPVGAAALAAALVAAAPATAVGAALSYLRRPAGEPRGGSAHRDNDPKTVLITGGKMTKAAELARHFAARGHRVILAESQPYTQTAHRAWNAVSRFDIVPRPEHDDAGYARALADIVRENRVDLVVPVSSPASARYEAGLHDVLDVPVFHPSVDQVDMLDDTHAFCESARAAGVAAPITAPVTSREAALAVLAQHPQTRFIVKPRHYDPVRRLAMPVLQAADTDNVLAALPISAERPWLLQAYLEGEEFCAHATVHAGRVTAYCCCPSSPFQVEYEHVERPAIEQWVTQYVSHHRLTGQVSFDLIATPDGRVLPIECNPRAHSAITSFNRTPAFTDAYLFPDRIGDTPVKPVDGGLTMWFGHALHQIAEARGLRSKAAAVRRYVSARDAVFDPGEPLPFLLLYHWHMPRLLLRTALAGRRWARVDFNIGKVVEDGGD